MAIAVKTDTHTKEQAEILIETQHFKDELEKNVSIRVLVSPNPQGKKKVFSLSAIINDWLKDIRKGNKSIVGITVPVATSLIKQLDKAVKNAWEVLTKA